MQNISFLKKVLLRTPLESTENQITETKIRKKLVDPKIQEALFIASPNFQSLLNDELTEKQLITLYKYYSRFSNRCTPFGLFASVGLVNVSDHTNLELNKTTLEKKIRYDMLFLGLLNDQINSAADIRNKLRYYPNNSLYQILDNFRYVEFYYAKNKRFHRLAEVAFNEYLDKILIAAKNGITVNELCEQLTDDSISFQEAEDFVLSIIDAQFLVSELDVTLTGNDYLDSLIEIFGEPRFNFPKGKSVRSNLTFLKQGLKNLQKPSTTIPNYLELFQKIKKLVGVDTLELNRLFQIDTYKPLSGNTLNNNTLKTLQNGIHAINKLTSPHENAKLKNFKSEYIRRYGHEMMPLSDALDPDTGINYMNISGAKTPLLNTIHLTKNTTENKVINHGEREDFLLKKILYTYQNNLTSIEIKAKELNSFEEDSQLYPDSFSVLFSLFREAEQEKIQLKSVSGPSANNLIGRFGYLHDDILSISKEICELEQRNHPNKLIAEIIHLPEARTGNILHRKFQREYEIPYLAKSSLPEENQICLTDLYITVKYDKVLLYSKKHNKEVIPRLGNAHNYSFMALPIYNFLCDIQNQYSSGFAFDWGEMAASFPFLPRLEYKNCILSKAQWNISKEDIDALLSNKRPSEDDVRNFVRNKKLPNLVVFVEGDNEVVINFKIKLSCSVFLSLIKNKKRVILQEYLMADTSATKGYANEFIAFGSKEEISSLSGNISNISTTKEFPSKSDWLYFKFYCGPSVAEQVLKDAIIPLVEKLKKDKVCEKWFFIRYNDTEGHHLRLRFKIPKNKEIHKVFSLVQKQIKVFTDSKTVWKVQTESYHPEFERYGLEIMSETETVFQNDSDCTLAFLNMIEGDEGEKIRWFFSLLSIDNYLDDFQLNDAQKLDIMKSLKDGFGSEFKKDKFVNKKVNAVYKENEKDICEILELSNKNHRFYPLAELVKERSAQNEKVLPRIIEYIKTNKVLNHQIVGSHIHMLCNRLFITKQREQEAIVYDFLYQYYKRKSYR